MGEGPGGGRRSEPLEVEAERAEDGGPWRRRLEAASPEPLGGRRTGGGSRSPCLRTKEERLGEQGETRGGASVLCATPPTRLRVRVRRSHAGCHEKHKKIQPAAHRATKQSSCLHRPREGSLLMPLEARKDAVVAGFLIGGEAAVPGRIYYYLPAGSEGARPPACYPAGHLVCCRPDLRRLLSLPLKATTARRG